MKKIRILGTNLAALAGTIVTASSSATDWPIANLKTIWPKYVHRTLNLGTPDFWEWDFGVAPSINYIILWNHNFQSTATVKLQADVHSGHWADVDLPLQYGVHWNDHVLVYFFRRPIANCLYWRVTADDSAPANPAGYLQAGYAYLGGFLQPAYSFKEKGGGVIDPSTILLSDGGQPSTNEKDAYETYDYDFSAATPADLVTLITYFKSLKKGWPFFIIEDDSYPLNVRFVRFRTDFNYRPFVAGYKSYRLEVEDAR
ncbi:MAG: hypothetical protein IMZ57_11205 [Acidobacteria bacterium]|nr:hypothetical protein [Acidobacteriota bacterium]